MNERRLAGIELGGTTWVCAIAAENNPLNIVAREEFPTTTPEETIGKALDWVDKQDFDSIGIASFGPIDLNKNSPTYGYITTTPKPNWGNTDIVGAFQKRFPGIPIGWDTDVNAPALCEASFGGHGDVDSVCYITLGTGVGVGVCINGKAVHGYTHPEGGHVKVPLAPADAAVGYKGTCPFHGACIEGMVCSQAIADRAGVSKLDLASLPDHHPVWETIAHYLAHLCANLTFTVSPQCIVIGGGISRRAKLFELIHEKYEKIVNGYVPYPDLKKYIAPSFHKEIGLVSSLELARLALN